MKVDDLITESTTAQQKQELIYNLKHRASHHTISAVAAVMNVAEEEPPMDTGMKPGIQEDGWLDTIGDKLGSAVDSTLGDQSYVQRYLRDPLVRSGIADPKTMGWKDGKSPYKYDTKPAASVPGPVPRNITNKNAPAGYFDADNVKTDPRTSTTTVYKDPGSDAAMSGYRSIYSLPPVSTVTPLPKSDNLNFSVMPDMDDMVAAEKPPVPSIPNRTGVDRANIPVGSMPAQKRAASGTYTSPYEPKRQAAGTYTAPYEPTVIKRGDNIWTLFNKKFGRTPTSKELRRLATINKISNWKNLQPGTRLVWNESIEEAVQGSKDLLIKHIMSLDPNKPGDADEIEKLYTFAMRHVIRDEVAKVLKAKTLPSTFTRVISSWFIDADGGYEERIKFLQSLPSSGYLNTDALTSPEPNNFENIRKHESIVYDSVKDVFMQYEGKIGGVAIGKGELYCIFFATGVYKGSPGDLRIEGKEAEVKAVKARFLATTGYGSTVSFFPTYRKMLQALVPKAQLPTDPNWFNWSYKGLHDLSDLFVRNGNAVACKHVIDKTLESLYVESTPSQRSRVVDVISDDGSFDVNSFLHAWVLMQFEYYKSIDGFDGILFINPSNFNFVYIENSLQLDDHWGLFHIRPSLSWKESRNITSQVSLV